MLECRTEVSCRDAIPQFMKQPMRSSSSKVVPPSRAPKYGLNRQWGQMNGKAMSLVEAPLR